MLHWFKSLLNKEDGIAALREQEMGLFTLRRYREAATMALNLIMDREARLTEISLLKEKIAGLLETLRQAKDNQGPLHDQLENLQVKVAGLDLVNANLHKELDGKNVTIQELQKKLTVANIALDNSKHTITKIRDIVGGE